MLPIPITIPIPNLILFPFRTLKDFIIQVLKMIKILYRITLKLLKII